MNIYETHKKLRKGGNVERFHTDRMLFRQNVAQHSFNAALLAYHIADYYSERSNNEVNPDELLRYMLIHDIAEQAVGDTPSFTKRKSKDLHRILYCLETEWMSKNLSDTPFFDLVAPNLTETDRIIAKFSDAFECACTCNEEIAMGNSNFKVILKRSTDFIRYMIEERCSNDPVLYDLLWSLCQDALEELE